MRALPVEHQARITAALSTHRGPFGEPPCTLSFGPRRVEIWVPPHIGRTAQAIAGGFEAYEVVGMLRRFGHGASVRFAPRPSEPRLAVVVMIGTPHPTAASPVPSSATPHGSWCEFEALAGAAGAEGAQLCRLDRDLAETRLGMKLEVTQAPMVLCTWGNGVSAWARAGLALAHVLDRGRTDGIAVDVAGPEIQQLARRNGIGVIEPDLGWTQIVLVLSPRLQHAGDQHAGDQHNGHLSTPAHGSPTSIAGRSEEMS